jgi:hypothetical protein
LLGYFGIFGISKINATQDFGVSSKTAHVWDVDWWAAEPTMKTRLYCMVDSSDLPVVYDEELRRDVLASSILGVV